MRPTRSVRMSGCLLSAATGCVQLSASVSKKRYTPRRKESFVGLVFPGNFNPSPNTSKPGSMRCKSTVLHLVDILPVLKGGLSFPGPERRGLSCFPSAMWIAAEFPGSLGTVPVFHASEARNGLLVASAARISCDLVPEFPWLYKGHWRSMATWPPQPWVATMPRVPGPRDWLSPTAGPWATMTEGIARTISRRR